MERIAAFLKKVPLSSDKLLRRSSSKKSSSSSSSSDYDEELCSSGFAAPVDVPEGCFAVYVGQERRRFVVRMQHLKHSLFKALLEKAAEEYGFEVGSLTIPCEAVFFEHILWLLNNNNDYQTRSLEIEELLDFYSA